MGFVSFSAIRSCLFVCSFAFVCLSDSFYSELDFVYFDLRMRYSLKVVVQHLGSQMAGGHLGFPVVEELDYNL